MSPHLTNSWLQRHNGNLMKATPAMVELGIFLQRVARVNTITQPAPLYLDLAVSFATNAVKRERLLALLDKCKEEPNEPARP